MAQRRSRVWTWGAMTALSLITGPAAWGEVLTEGGSHAVAWCGYTCPAVEKLGRGLSNVAWGWLEVPLNMETRYRASDTATSLTTGALYGAFNAVGRTLIGAFETVTFFLPVPERYAPILPPLAYFDKASKRPQLFFD